MKSLKLRNWHAYCSRGGTARARFLFILPLTSYFSLLGGRRTGRTTTITTRSGGLLSSHRFILEAVTNAFLELPSGTALGTAYAAANTFFLIFRFPFLLRVRLT